MNQSADASPALLVIDVQQGLDNPRLIRVSPSGDLFIAESRPGRIRVLRAPQRGGKSEIRIFAEDLDQPFGIAFWPPDQAAKDDLLSSRATPQNPPDYHVEAAASFGDGGRAGTVQTLSYSAEMSLLV